LVLVLKRKKIAIAMIVVGLTGSISCGKSTVCRLLVEELDQVHIIDLDAIARQLLAPGTPVYRAVVARFGSTLLRGPGKELDREQLAATIFSDASHRRWLNGQTHWRIALVLVRELVWAWLTGRKRVVLDAPLLFESGLNKICTTTVAIHLSAEHQIERLMARDQISRDFALQKISCQMSTDEKCARAAFVVENNGSLQETRKSVQDVFGDDRLPNPSFFMDRWKVLATFAIAVFAIRLIL
jgi:dephospho-CoA kinase